MARWYHLSGDSKWTRTNVRTYAGNSGEPEPQSFAAGSQQMDVVEITDRWAMANHRYFKVKARNRAICVLRHDQATGAWEMTSVTQQR